MDNQAEKILKQALSYENEGEYGKASDCYRQLIQDDDQNQGPLLFQLAASLFQAGEYGEALDVFVKCHKAGHQCMEVEEIVLEAYHQPNLKDFADRYAENVKHFSNYQFCHINSFPKFESLSYRFIPYSETKYIIFDNKAKKFLSQTELADQGNIQKFHKNAVLMIKNEFNVCKLSKYVEDTSNKEDKIYVTTSNPLYLIYESEQIFFEFLQISPFGELLGNDKCIFLFGFNQVKEFFLSKDALLPSHYINMAGQEDPYYFCVEQLRQKMLKSGDVSYQNLMAIFNQSFNAMK